MMGEISFCRFRTKVGAWNRGRAYQEGQRRFSHTFMLVTDKTAHRMCPSPQSVACSPGRASFPSIEFHHALPSISCPPWQLDKALLPDANLPQASYQVPFASLPSSLSSLRTSLEALECLRRQGRDHLPPRPQDRCQEEGGTVRREMSCGAAASRERVR